MKRVFTSQLVMIFIFVLSSNYLQAQTLSEVPDNIPNTRFGSQDVFVNKIVRPTLSLRGFDSSNLTGGTAHGIWMWAQKYFWENFVTNCIQNTID